MRHTSQKSLMNIFRFVCYAMLTISPVRSPVHITVTSTPAWWFNHPLYKLPPGGHLCLPPWHRNWGPKAVFRREELWPQLGEGCLSVPGHNLSAILVVVAILNQWPRTLKFLSSYWKFRFVSYQLAVTFYLNADRSRSNGCLAIKNLKSFCF